MDQPWVAKIKRKSYRGGLDDRDALREALRDALRVAERDRV